jgi:CDP-glucose 4,6-dehydratase
MIFDYYKDKKVFITGHTGFKGAWLTKWLLLIGAKVKGYSLANPYPKSIYYETGIEENIASVIADIRDLNKLKTEIQNFEPEIVFHLAAQPLVSESYVDPIFTYQTNVIGTANLLEACRNIASIKKIIIVTTDKCYENKESTEGYSETDPLGGYDPYSASKACAEILTSSYRNSFFNQSDCLLFSARAGNVIGGGDWSKDRIIVDTINSISKGLSVELRNPNYVRPWQFVLEPISGYLLLGVQTNKKFANAWNFGPTEDKPYSVKEIVEKSIYYWGEGKWHSKTKVSDFHETKFLRLKIDKAIKELNWKPALTIDEVVEFTISWYKNQYYKKVNLNEFTENQILKYISIAKEKKIFWAVN